MLNFSDLTQKCLEKWEKSGLYLFEENLSKEKFYLLNMFPYPSGQGLHVGHLKGYLASDIICRLKTMQGYNVFHPMGWDSFGLPAEQYAIKTKNHPKDFTQKNIDRFRSQLLMMGFSFHFSHELMTSDPAFFKTTQETFSLMVEDGMASLRFGPVNWVEALGTVISNEEIWEDEKGNCFSERGDYPVEIRPMKQWFISITNYSEELINGLESLDWPAHLKAAQKSWIGKVQKWRYLFDYQGKEYSFLVDMGFKPVSLTVHALSRLCLDFPDFEKAMVKVGDFRLPITRDSTIKGRAEDFVVEQIECPGCSRNGASLVTSFYLQDWVFSRQRFWGEPIPVLFGPDGEIVLERNLPLCLPESGSLNLKENPWSRMGDFNRETSTMPGWAGSCWYYLGYLMKKTNGFQDLKKSFGLFEKWMPVDLYIGGKEHATSHLIYSRFWYRYLFNKGLVPTPEPFQRVVNQGLILDEFGKKMSKSKGNCVDPDGLRERFGADTLRLHISFLGPLTENVIWDESGLLPLHTWLMKVSKKLQNVKLLEDDMNLEMNRQAQEFSEKVQSSIRRYKFNGGVSHLMTFFNSFGGCDSWTNSAYSVFVQILGLYAPFVGEELWSRLDKKTPLHNSVWTTFESKGKEYCEIIVQLNNKVRCVKKFLQNPTKEEVMNAVQWDDDLKKELKKVERIIFVPNKLINIIT